MREALNISGGGRSMRSWVALRRFGATFSHLISSGNSTIYIINPANKSKTFLRRKVS